MCGARRWLRGTSAGNCCQPPSMLGKFQDLMSAPQSEDKRDLTLPDAKPQPEPAKREPTPELYVDAAVVAFPVQDEDAITAAQKPVITCSCGAIDEAVLQDGSFAKAVEVSHSEDGTAWVEFAYAKPQLVQSVLYGGGMVKEWSGLPIKAGRIEASDDEKEWKTLVELPGSPKAAGSINMPVRTFAIAPVKARYYRLFFNGPQPSPHMRDKTKKIEPNPVELGG